MTGPLFAWTWSGVSQGRFSGRLNDFRPADGQTVIEMMDGKYLLADRLVNTGGVSPFAVEADSPAWSAELHGFAWLRHFNELRDRGQRRFARTLVMDWIGRFSDFDREAWDPLVTARRILNWLRNYDLLVEDANPDQRRSIARALASQIQSLKVRSGLLADPLPRLLAAVALVGAALCSEEEEKHLPALLARLQALLDAQIDGDGMHLSRAPHIQIELLCELIPVNQALSAHHAEAGLAVARKVEAMHRALDRLILGTREPVYMNGCGQLPVDLVLAVSAQSGARSAGPTLSGGYGILVDGQGKLVADSGQVPPIAYADTAHAGGLSFEFSSGGTLVAGNCGPAPEGLSDSATLFRHTSAHSAPTIDDISSARLGGAAILGTRLRPRGAPPEMTLDAAENALDLCTHAYRKRYGLDIRRRLTLMGGGQTLVGEDRFVAATRQQVRQGEFYIRFHLAPGADAERSRDEALISLTFKNGEIWSFLWEGAEAGIEDSVRHSAWLGLNRTRQIVLSGPARPGTEIAWIFTRQSG